MLLEDKGRPTKYHTIRKNYYIIIDNERMTIKKLAQNLGFYTVVFSGKMNEKEIYYDTDGKLLTSVGLLLRKKVTPQRAYFSLVRVNNLTKSMQLREKKSFLGECEFKDEPRDFPVQIADEINNIFNNLFTINLVDIVKHSSPYIRIDITGNKYKIISGTGCEIFASFENLNIRDMRTGRKMTKRIFSIKMEDDPSFAKEREHVDAVIARYCKEVAPVMKNRFEIAETCVVSKVVPEKNKKENDVKNAKKAKKNKKKQENSQN